MKAKSLLFAVGSILLLSSAAYAQRATSQLSAYKTSNGAVWITGLRAQTQYDIKTVPINNRSNRPNNPSTQDLQRRSDACGAVQVPQAVNRFKSLSVNGQTFNLSSLATQTHRSCNSSGRN